MKNNVIAIAGNPNVGKTSLFNVLTGAKHKTGNWPGVTVEKKTGVLKVGDKNEEIVDLPGIYSLSASSLDELVARNFILDVETGPDVLINIIDASNLERNLYLTLQLLEMQIPTIIALNMNDIAKKRNIEVDIKKLSDYLEIPVVKINAHKESGKEELVRSIEDLLKTEKKPRKISYGRKIDSAIKDVLKVCGNTLDEKFHHENWAAIKILENDKDILNNLKLDSELVEIRKNLESSIGDDLEIFVAEKRYEVIEDIAEKCRKGHSKVRKEMPSDKVDKIILNRILGLPIFLLVMWMMFKFAVDIGGGFIDFFDGFFGTIFVDGLRHLLESKGWLKVFLADGLGGGIQTVATFIPPIFFLFFAIALLEDSGYMARAAFVIDRLMRSLGLPGKAFMPMLMGFGCNVPAVMASRTLEDEDDRKQSILMNPFMSCGARLPVYTLLAAAFFPSIKGTITFSIYIIGIILAVITGLVYQKFIKKNKKLSPFVMELPPYHAPRLKFTFISAFSKTASFIKKAGLMVLIIVVLLQVLGNFSIGVTEGDKFEAFGKNSLIGKMGKVMTYPLKPMGIEEQNWPAAVGLFTGLFAKEAIIGTLDSSYKAMEVVKKDGEKEDQKFDFWAGIGNSFVSIKNNLIRYTDDAGNWEAGILAKKDFYIPFYEFTIGLAEDSEDFTQNKMLKLMFEDKSIKDKVKRKKTASAASYAYLLFILIYVPCVAVMGAIYKELGGKWLFKQILFQTILAYSISVGFFQIAKVVIN